MASDVSLRKVNQDDLPIFFEDQMDPEAARIARFPSRDKDAFMAHWSKIMIDDTCILRTILFHGQVAGNIGCWPQGGMTLVGYWISKKYWGKGIATAALGEILGLVAARPLHAYVAKQNAASIRVLEKCGFETVGEEDHDYIMMLADNPKGEAAKGRP
ncbi:MAG TPA: GNAT family N-acetyltransferase [Candidatus Krumholzibacteria bacterium]|jgi:RimJ/RimL family protein N-acetyltransferase|nr:GNAT family N-acetyltransferase [Candidatus Krumholzibacteria bacterium]